MTEKKPQKLEHLLESLGSEEALGDSVHRYALRRALLNSPEFNNNSLTKRWPWFYQTATSIFAGGLVVVVLAVGANTYETMSAEDGKSTITIRVAQPAAGIESSSSSNNDEELVILPRINSVTVPEAIPAEHVIDFVKPDLELAVSQN